jgi:Tfp pilus assembly protein PilW
MREENNKNKKVQSGSSMIEYIGLVLMVLVAIAAITSVFKLVSARFEAPPVVVTPPTTTLP